MRAADSANFIGDGATDSTWTTAIINVSADQ